MTKGTGKSKEARVDDVRDAVKALPAALTAARQNADDVALWAEVERLGAIVHRQSRLLAGKPRGG